MRARAVLPCTPVVRDNGEPGVLHVRGRAGCQLRVAEQIPGTMAPCVERGIRVGALPDPNTVGRTAGSEASTKLRLRVAPAGSKPP